MQANDMTIVSAAPKSHAGENAWCFRILSA